MTSMIGGKPSCALCGPSVTGVGVVMQRSAGFVNPSAARLHPDSPGDAIAKALP